MGASRSTIMPRIVHEKEHVKLRELAAEVEVIDHESQLP